MVPDDDGGGGDGLDVTLVIAFDVIVDAFGTSHGEGVNFTTARPSLLCAGGEKAC